eukprot:TRINITY_DN13764_c0_g1_i3.p1 TRINITY_DN13764_c0_g1~~TRINITY_DN13764_c0_g1_i3.p1  ORF type:complete len:347 (-),score=82.61 TRINITY_DN13764_c0_g1_i3:131-1171(-)
MQNQMEYRSVGPSGLRVSVLSYGNWLTSQAVDQTEQLVLKAWEHGINTFDCADVTEHHRGISAEKLGHALKKLNVGRADYVVSSRLTFGPTLGVNRIGHSRKNILDTANDMLRLLQLDFTDLMICNRFDHDTPLEETVRAMDWLVNNNKCLYWGTSEWSAEDIRRAHAICDRLGLVAPIVEQPQYSMLQRERFEVEYAELFREGKIGSMVWTPLAGGILTGKFREGIDANESKIGKIEPVSARSFYARWLGDSLLNTNKILDGLDGVAKELGGTLPQLALAWTLTNPDVSTIILGASKVTHLEDNIRALDIYRRWTPDVETRVSTILANAPQSRSSKKAAPFNPRR